MNLKSFLKKIFTITFIATIFIYSPKGVSADESIGSFSANVGLFSEYSFRGIDQSGEEAAIQGGFDWVHASGLYVGTWASNVDFNDNDSVTEFDFYGGFATELNGGINIDLSMISYTYPGAFDSSNYDFYEYAFGLEKSIGSLSLSTAINYSPEFFGKSGDATYLQGGADYSLPMGITLSGHIGKQWIDLETTYGAPDYIDYSIGGSYSWQSFDLSLTYVDTDVDENWNSTNQDGKDGRVIFGVSRSF
jgi:uncharacterized protein (TIGR02001 family)